MIKIYLDGAKFYGDQLTELSKGFVALGYEVTDFISEATLIYSNNPSNTRAQIVKDKLEGKLKPDVKLIFNMLDVPIHLLGNADFLSEMNDNKVILGAADAITSISEYTRDSVKKYYGFDSTVIYNPIKPITNLGIKDKPYFGCIVGRKMDPNKNVAAVIQALEILGIDEKQVLMVGAESIKWGNYCGVLSDENLNLVYNSCHFSFSMGEIEGLNLPVVEAMAAGCIPVVNSRLTTRQELLPSDLFPEYDYVEANPTSIALFIARYLQDNQAMELMKERLYSHYVDNLREKFTGKAVAQKIINLYEKL